MVKGQSSISGRDVNCGKKIMTKKGPTQTSSRKKAKSCLYCSDQFLCLRQDVHQLSPNEDSPHGPNDDDSSPRLSLSLHNEQLAGMARASSSILLLQHHTLLSLSLFLHHLSKVEYASPIRGEREREKQTGRTNLNNLTLRCLPSPLNLSDVAPCSDRNFFFCKVKKKALGFPHLISEKKSLYLTHSDSHI